MLNHNERRPAFDAFFASLDAVSESVFLDAAAEQRHGLQEEVSYPVSLIDCMENVWDLWTELGQIYERETYTLMPNEKGIALAMTDPARIERERAYRAQNS